MAAYYVAETEVTDPNVFEEYRKLASGIVEKYGGEYLARGSAIQTVEGDWAPKRMVIIKFPSLEQANRWYNSPEYAKAKPLRHKAARTKSVFAEGL